MAQNQIKMMFKDTKTIIINNKKLRLLELVKVRNTFDECAPLLAQQSVHDKLRYPE